MAKKDEVHELLEELGARFLRKNKHEFWMLPSGDRVAVSCTPSDHRSNKNKLAEIKRLMKNHSTTTGDFTWHS